LYGAEKAGRAWAQPKYAAYLNLIEPWWKARRSLAPEERGFECKRLCQDPRKPQKNRSDPGSWQSL
jgi:hypothetical protein